MGLGLELDLEPGKLEQDLGLELDLGPEKLERDLGLELEAWSHLEPRWLEQGLEHLEWMALAEELGLGGTQLGTRW